MLRFVYVMYNYIVLMNRIDHLCFLLFYQSVLLFGSDVSYDYNPFLKEIVLKFFLTSFILLCMYIKNHRYTNLTPVFRLYNIHLEFSTYPHKFKRILYTEKKVLNASFQDFWYTNINNHMICLKKRIKKF